jgi:hypothetical protein
MKDTVVFTFGRFNPPTTGHEKLIEKLASVAKKEGADFMVFPSHSQNDKKDPLDHKTKVGFMKKMFPKYSRNIISNRNAKTAFMIAPMLYDMGYKRCIMVVGGDRVTEFKTTLNKYNGKKGSHGFYDFKGGIEVVSAGERDPDAEGVTGMSASKMRAAAAANRYEDEKDPKTGKILNGFKSGLPSAFEKSNGKKLFDTLRKSMNISEELLEFLEATNADFSRFIETEFVEIVEDIEDEILMESVYKELDFKIGIDDDYDTVYKKIYNNEEVSQKQIDDLEKFADRMLAKYDIDVTFTRHFVDRMNDKRNDPEIKVAELQKFFKKIQKKKGSQIKSNPDIEAVLKDMSTNLNLPVIINYKNGDFEVVHKTIMRKKNFSTSSKELKYESLEEANYQVDIEGLPTFYVDASSAGEVKNNLRKMLKNPKIIKDVEKVTDGEVKKDFRDRITGKDEGVSRAQQAAIAIAKKKSGKYDKDGNKIEDCWPGYKQVGMKKKSGKDVPNCVPEDFKMNPEREKDLEKIAKDLPDDDFKKRYGDEWMQVKMATAMNILKKKLGYSTEDLEEIAWLHRPRGSSRTVKFKKKKDVIEPTLKDKIAARRKLARKIGDKLAYKMSWQDVMKAVNEDAEIKSFSQFIYERKTTQDPDIKDKDGSQPKKYYAKDADGDEMSKSTKDKRAAHFKKQASKPDGKDSSYKPAPGDADAETKPSQYTKKYKQMFGEDSAETLDEAKIAGLVKKADKSGISYEILKKVYDRGMAAWKGGHRPGTTPQQWAFARVNSFITGGKTRTTGDADLWAKVKK